MYLPCITPCIRTPIKNLSDQCYFICKKIQKNWFLAMQLCLPGDAKNCFWAMQLYLQGDARKTVFGHAAMCNSP
jgi:hypothetical protein